MTAGYSKGKKRYYPYYRCIEHVGLNIPADKLHAEFKQLMYAFNLSDNQKETIAAKAEFLLSKTLQDQKSIIEARLKQKTDIARKLNNLDELLLEKQIDGATFERLKARLHEEIHMLDNSYYESVNISQKWVELEKVLFKTNTMRDVFEMATLANKYSLIRKLFHPQLVYKEGKFMRFSK